MFVNLTPHAINIVDETNQVIATFASEGVARAAQKTEFIGVVDGVRITKSTFGEPVNLPEFVDGVYLIVSLATASAAKQFGRRVDDLLITNEAVRDDQGRIIGCRSLAVVE